MANFSGCQNCQRSGIAILSAFLHMQAPPESCKTTSIKLEEFCQNLAETYSTSASTIHLIMRIHLTMRGVNGVKEQKGKKVKLLLWKTETLQPPVPRPLMENWEQREISAVFPAFILAFSRYPGTSVLITSASDGIPVFTQDLAYTGTTAPSGNVPTWRCCVWATGSLKVSSLKIILSGFVLLTAAVSWQPLSLQLQGPELNEFPIKNGLCISKDMPIADAASPCSLYSLQAEGIFLRDSFIQEL